MLTILIFFSWASVGDWYHSYGGFVLRLLTSVQVRHRQGSVADKQRCALQRTARLRPADGAKGGCKGAI